MHTPTHLPAHTRMHTHICAPHTHTRMHTQTHISAPPPPIDEVLENLVQRMPNVQVSIGVRGTIMQREGGLGGGGGGVERGVEGA